MRIQPPLIVFSLVASLAATAVAQTLRQEADRAGLLVGTAVNPVYLSEPAYTSTLVREFNMIEPEDAMKWTAIRPDEKTFNFASADRLVDFARTHNMRVRGHNLMWGIHNPKWLEDGHYTSHQLEELLHDHIQRVVERYRGRVFAWDVVNEAFDENGGLRDSIWYNQPGIGLAKNHTAYIEQAFRWAHATDPKVLLFYNDAGAEAVNRKSDAVYEMVRDFKRRGVPIDGVGLQMHIFNLDQNVKSIAENISRFTKLGVQIQITEMDVALPVDAAKKPSRPEDLLRQAEIYGQIATACLQNPGCTAIQTWGFTDKYSWIGWFTHGTEDAGLVFDRQYHAKPAYDALRKAVAARPSK
ncbi:MAG TPA: endo-1,4-beta-xylanase [Terriglobales bacterium]|nr:endo-1,4-beta-xylanase [Terriglobales bacterium]